MIFKFKQLFYNRNWFEDTEIISKIIDKVTDKYYGTIEYNISKSALHPNNLAEDENVR